MKPAYRKRIQSESLVNDSTAISYNANENEDGDHDDEEEIHPSTSQINSTMALRSGMRMRRSKLSDSPQVDEKKATSRAVRPAKQSVNRKRKWSESFTSDNPPASEVSNEEEDSGMSDDDYVDEKESLPSKSRVNTSKVPISRMLKRRSKLSDSSPVDEKEATPPVGQPARRMYCDFDKNSWSPLYLYRTTADITVARIRQSGSEGFDRVEIGRAYGVNSKIKSGNRRVSGYILQSMKAFPDYFGQYQKLEGRYRCIKYFYKFTSGPRCFDALFAQWKGLASTDCPFKLEQVLKFPNTNLSTLRISDVTLRRIIDMLRIVKTRSVVTMNALHKLMADADREYKYGFTMDRKSTKKCLRALEKTKLVHLLTTTVVHNGIECTIQLICEKSIRSVEEQVVKDAILKTIDDYDSAGRMFPFGQIKMCRTGTGNNLQLTKSNGQQIVEFHEMDVKDIEALSGDNMTIKNRITLQRYNLVRLQNLTKLVESEKSPTQKTLLNDNGPEELNTDKSVCKGLHKLDGKAARDYGRQSKMIRCSVLHQLVWHFIYGLPEETRPTLYERFPPIEPVDERVERVCVDELPVYVDEESPYRFMPVQPRFKDLPCGWFILQDLYKVIPASVYCLIDGANVELDGIEKFLVDPVRRHIPIYDLPSDLKRKISRNKRAIKQIEQHLMHLCALGLLSVASESVSSKYNLIDSQLFFVLRGGTLRDTSTSDLGYASVTPPIEKYDKYDYEFNSIEDVELYWQHLRAIVQSTPLARKDQNPNKGITNVKRIRSDCGDWSKIYRSFDDEKFTSPPIPPNDGCAGCHSRLFIHRKQNWDLNPQPTKFVNWFLHSLRRTTDKHKGTVQKRVRIFRQNWRSPKSVNHKDPRSVDIKHLRSSVCRNSSKKSTDGLSERTSTLKSSEKCKADQIDIVCAQRRTIWRTRFSARERHMLILIRAVGFFLCPVYRFWLDTAVMRDIMHERVPESRSKTVRCLLSASVRDIARNDKMMYLKRIVRCLASFPEMREFRTRLTANPLNTSKEKRDFFLQAFNTAFRLLSRDSANICSCNTPDEDFEKYLADNNMKIATELESPALYPIRSQKPTDSYSIRYCIAYNVVVSSLLQNIDIGDPIQAVIIQQITSIILSDLLDRLRKENIISRRRLSSEEGMSIVSTRRVNTSNLFRSFFNHRYHPDIVEQTNQIRKSIIENDVIDEDTPGALVNFIRCFYDNSRITYKVGQSILDVFDNIAANQTRRTSKQLRYLESADIKLGDVALKLTLDQSEDRGNGEKLDEMVESLKRLIPVATFKIKGFEDFLLDYRVKDRGLLRAVYEIVENSKLIGASIKEISERNSDTRVDWALKELEKATQIVRVGIDCTRFVLDIYSDDWLVHSGDYAFFPTPWTLQNGELNIGTFRWMSKGVLFQIVNLPCCTINSLEKKFLAVLQPRMLMELIELLERSGCVSLKRCEVIAKTIKSPFSDGVEDEIVEYVVAAKDAIDRFSRMVESNAKSYY